MAAASQQPGAGAARTPEDVGNPGVAEHETEHPEQNE